MTIHCANMNRVQARFLLDYMRLLSQIGREGEAPRADRFMILAAVVLATIEGKPFRAQKLSEYLKMPRTSVLRRLEDLRADGWVSIAEDGRVSANLARLNSPDVLGICDQLSTLIHRAHHSLLEIEQKENKTVQSGH